MDNFYITDVILGRKIMSVGKKTQQTKHKNTWESFQDVEVVAISGPECADKL